MKKLVLAVVVLSFGCKHVPTPAASAIKKFSHTTNRSISSDTLLVKFHGDGNMSAPLDIRNDGGIGIGKDNFDPASLWRLSYALAIGKNVVYNRAWNHYTAFSPERVSEYLEIGEEGLSTHIMPAGLPLGSKFNNVDDRLIWMSRAKGVRNSGGILVNAESGVRLQNMTGVYSEKSADPTIWSSSSFNSPFGEYRKDGENITPEWIYQSAYNDKSSQYQIWEKARGILKLPRPTLKGDTIYNLKARTFGGFKYYDAAQIVITSDGDATEHSTPGSIVFKTTPPQSKSPVDRLTINSTGEVAFSADIKAASFIKKGGKPYQFLMADGSVRNASIYQTVVHDQMLVFFLLSFSCVIVALIFITIGYLSNRKELKILHEKINLLQKS